MSSKPSELEDALRRLEEIVELVKDKEISLEQSLELLEEGVELANLYLQGALDALQLPEKPAGGEDSNGELP